MPKVKTKSAAKKRFRVAGSSSHPIIKRAKAYRRHMLLKKTANQKRRLRKGGYVSDADFSAISALLPR